MAFPFRGRWLAAGQTDEVASPDVTALRIHSFRENDLISHGCAATASPEGEASLTYISSPVKLNPAFTMSSGSLVNMELMD